jgi:hypothetical protein
MQQRQSKSKPLLLNETICTEFHKSSLAGAGYIIVPLEVDTDIPDRR